MPSPQVDDARQTQCYTVRPAHSEPSLDAVESCPEWAQAEELEVADFHPKSSSHRPVTTARMLSHGDRLYVTFEVKDRYVRSVRTEYQANVCKDSCVEFFVKPKADKGYINFEINAGGTMLLHYNPPNLGPGPREMVLVPAELAREVTIRGSLPPVVDPEITEPIDWRLSFSFPVSLLEQYVGPLRPLAGQAWTANFYKIASDSSHPHWASWNSVGPQLNFHQPDRFGRLRFG